MWLQQTQDDIAHRLDRGERLADIEAKLGDLEADLNDDERAALWLFA